jgi:hypothetical protein
VDDVDTSTALAYIFVAGIAGLFVTLLALEWYMLGRTRASLAPTRVAMARRRIPTDGRGGMR